MSPGFHIHTGNRLELLADHLAALIRDNPLPPFVPERVVVQSFGMRRWLQFELASRLGICADLQCPFARGFFQDLLQNTLGTVLRQEDGPGAEPGAAAEILWPEPEHLLWRIMKVLREGLADPELGPLTAYFADRPQPGEGESRIDPGRLYQISRNLAELFDQYFIYRPGMLRGWDAGQCGEQEDAWQQHLWQRVFADRPWLHPGALQKRFLEKCRDGDLKEADLPARVILFGISSLPPFYLDLLQGLARFCPVYLYAFQPCAEFWADLKSRKQEARERARFGELEQTVPGHPGARDETREWLRGGELGHPLLSTMGRQGRAFQGLLLDLDEAETTEHFTGSADHLLHRVQCDLLELKNRGANHPEAPEPCRVEPGDASLQIHPCHSPLREMQVLRNVLLEAFEKDPGLEPQDVVVMFPDVEAYAPYIEAVFDSPEETDRPEGAGQNPQRIPFTIADRSPRSSGGVIQAFLKMLELPRSRFALSEILDLLDLDIIKTANDWTAEDLEQLRRMINQAQIRWGLDSGHRASLELPATAPNTWRAGLDGLMLGWILGEQPSPALPELSPVTPLPGDAWALLARFDDFLRNLAELEQSLRQPKPVQDWARVLRDRVDQFFGGLQEPEASEEMQVLLDALRHLGETADAADFTDPVPGDAVISQLSRQLRQERSAGGFLSGGVTFCALKPLRSIPFKMVWLAGLNDGVFPRSHRRPSYDLIARRPRPGDRSTLDEERYLFLEALLSARDRLGISYLGFSLEDNSPHPPSILVRELEEYLQQGFRSAEGGDVLEQITTRHMLHPFHPRYFSGSQTAGPGEFNYSRLDARVAEILKKTRRTERPRPFFPGPLEPEEASAPAPAEITLEGLIRFFSNPCRHFLRHRLRTDLQLEQEEVSDSELFTVEGLPRYQLLELLLDHQLRGGSPGELYPVLLNRGLLPHGEPGRIDFLNLCRDIRSFGRMLEPLLGTGRPETEERVLDLEDSGEPAFHLTGVLPPLLGCGLVHFRPSTLKSNLRLEAWITHLALNCAASDLPPETRQSWIAGIEKNQPALYRLQPLEPALARQHLTELARISLGADREPLPFFPRASWAFAEKLLDPDSEDPAAPMKEARKAFRERLFKDYGQPGDLEDPAIAAFYAEHPQTAATGAGTPGDPGPGRVPIPHLTLGDPLDTTFQTLSQTVYKPLIQCSERVQA